MADDFYRSLADSLRGAESTDWLRIARPGQLISPEPWWTLQMWLAGRGYGKTLALTQNARTEIEAGRAGYVAAVGASAADCRDILAEGPCGFLAIAPKWNRPTYEPSKRRITWTNGATVTLFSADEPDRGLRGTQHDLAICDELAAWRYPDAFDNLMFGLRLKRTGSRPRCLIATTPRPTKIIKALLARERTDANPTGDAIVIRGSTFENAANLAPSFITQVLERYRGTRLERQEVYGEVLLDVPGALFNLENLEQTRVQSAPPDLERVVVGVDPAGSSVEGSDETGVVVSAKGRDGHAYVLRDLSAVMAPLDWARAAVLAFHEHRADLICAEANYGGQMVAANINSVDPNVPVKLVTSSRGKILRAEPVASLFAQGRAHLVGSYPALEDQLCRFTSDWDRARDGSPDRIDAMVFALSELMLGQPASGVFREEMFRSSDPVFSRHPNRVFCVIGTSHEIGPECDGVAALFCAESNVGGNSPLVLIDYDYVGQDTAFLNGNWIETIGRQLAVWSSALLAESAGIWVEKTPLGSAIFELGAGRRLPMYDVNSEQPNFPAALLDRIALTSRFVGTGLVRVAPEAATKATLFGGVTANHMMKQLLAYGSTRDTTPQRTEFLHALCIACAISLEGNMLAARALEGGSLPAHDPVGPQYSQLAAQFIAKQPDPEVQRMALQRNIDRMEKYRAEKADYDARAAVALAQIRAKLGDPHWMPKTNTSLGIGPPPVNPAASIGVIRI